MRKRRGISDGAVVVWIVLAVCATISVVQLAIIFSGPKLAATPQAEQLPALAPAQLPPERSILVMPPATSVQIAKWLPTATPGVVLGLRTDGYVVWGKRTGELGAVEIGSLPVGDQE